MERSTRTTKWWPFVAIFLVLALIAAACGGDDGDDGDATETAATEAAVPEAEPEPEPEPAGDDAAGDADEPAATAEEPAELRTVTWIMDYFPTPAHDGLAVAVQLGYFAEEGIELDILPWSFTRAESLVATGEADAGYSFGAGSAAVAFAGGLPVTAVCVIHQHSPGSVGVHAESDIMRPADLAGRLYGSFGNPIETARVNMLIAADGGEGVVDEVILAVAAYEAVEAGEIDAAGFYMDDIYIARQNDNEIRRFLFADYGLSDDYGSLLVVNSGLVESDPDLVGGLVRALVRGYEFAFNDPAAARDLLVAQWPDEIDPGLVEFVQQRQVDWLYVNTDGGGTCEMSKERWDTAGEWLFATGLLADENGDPLAEPLDFTRYVTNEFIPGAAEFGAE